jgi:hypothetical protein
MKAFNHGLVVADFASMPSACSVWAAFWTNGPNWPHNTGPLAYSGEVYIVEGVNLKSSLVNFLGSPFYYRFMSDLRNQFTFHTGAKSGVQCSKTSACYWR